MHVLVARVGHNDSIVCAIPIAHVVETMRPLPIVNGSAIVRGLTTPVIDTALLFGAERSPPTRFVIVRGNNKVALTFAAVIDVRQLSADMMASLPALATVAHPDALAAAAAIDRELVAVLRAARVMPEAAR